MNPRNHHPVIDAAERLRVFAGFGFNGYRSFGVPGEMAQVGPLGTIHLLVGKNNSGKSNVLRSVSDVLTKLPGFDVEASFAEVFPHSLDVNANWDVTEPIRFSVGLYLGEFLQSPWFADESFTLGERILSEPPFHSNGEGIIWFGRP